MCCHWILEAEERATVALVEDGDLARIDSTVEQMLTCCLGIGYNQLEASHRARRHLLLARQVADDDRAS